MRKLILLIALLIPLISLAQGSREVSGAKAITDSKLYKRSFLDDGGDFQDHPYHIADGLTKAFYRMCYINDIRDSIKFAYLGEAADKVREDGVYDYITDVYDLGLTNDGSQTTESSQPYKTGNIAPSERVGMLNPNGDSRYMDITPLTVSGTWTITKAELTDTGRVLITHTELTSGTISTITPNNAIYAYIVRSEQLTDAQKTAEAAFLQSIYPPIPTVKIGDQEWATSNFDAVATCQGNVIANVTENANVDIIDYDFSTDQTSNFSTYLGNTSYNSVNESMYFTASSNGAQIYKYSAGFSSNLYYRITYDARSVNYASVVNFNGNKLISTISNPPMTTSYQEYSAIIKILGTSAYLTINIPSGSIIEFDNVLLEKVGWAGSQELYDVLIAQGESVYDATKAAAMWSYPNNDSQIGSWSGKIYNKFAASLIQQDIDLYNASNDDWGFHIPTRVELTTLSAVGGIKAKAEGTNYWTTANGTNSNGLTLLGAGYRNDSGVYTDNKLTTGILSSDGYVRKVIDSDDTFSELSVTVEGYQIRLVKD